MGRLARGTEPGPMVPTNTLPFELDIIDKYEILFLIILDDAFSTGTWLERAGIARPVRCLWMLGSSIKTRNKKDRWGRIRCLSNA